MKNEFRTTSSTGLTESFASSAQRVVTIDVARYQSYLDGTDASDERKEEILRAMFSIIRYTAAASMLRLRAMMSKQCSLTMSPAAATLSSGLAWLRS